MKLVNKNKYELKVGQFVRSISGRDKGEVFIIFQIVDEDYVLIVDGKIRRINKPKKKKIRHLQKINTYIDEFEEMKYKNEFNDAFIRKLIKFKDLLGGLNYVK